MLLNFFRSQKAHLAQLTKQERALLYSYTLFALAHPIFLVYTNTFLWRQTTDPIAIIFFNIGIYTGVAFGFVVNTIGLRFLAARHLYFIACILSGLVPVALVTLVPQANNLILGLGLIYGTAAGVYWANRNYFTSLITRSKHRFTYLSLEHGLNVIASIAAPAAIGWFIAFGDKSQTYSATDAYLISVIIGLLLLVLAGYAGREIRSSTEEQRPKRWLLHGASPVWNQLRRMDFFNGLMHGVDMIVPLLLTLTLIGLEDAVGTLQTAASIAAAVALYTLAKHRNNLRQGPVLWLWLGMSIALAVLVTVSFSSLSIVIFTIVGGLFGPFRGAAIASILYETIDKEAPNERSLYLLDREILLNLGRVASLVILAFCFSQWPDFTLRFALTGVLVIRLFFVMAASTVDDANAVR